MRLALIVANNQYDDPKFAGLKAPQADAQLLAGLLEDPQIGAFDQVHVLLDPPWAEAQTAVADFFADKKPDDLLLFYFSGHGVKDLQGRLYLGLRDTRINRLSASSLASHFIKDEMDNSRARQQVLVLDCCYSGAFGRGVKGAVGQPVMDETTFQGRGRVVLTATDTIQYAWEGDQVLGDTLNSLYTHFVIEGLQTGQADVDGDGRVTPDELYEYVFDRVQEATPDQKPGKIVYNQYGEILLAYNPHPPILSKDILPSELRQALENPLAAVRAGAVEELGRLLKSRDLAQAARQSLEALLGDDSRRVSDAARALLQPLTATEIVKPKPVPSRSAGERRSVSSQPSPSRPQASIAQSSNSEISLDLAPGVPLILRRVPAGEFLMGSDPKKDGLASSDEQPQHTVTLDEYWIGKCPVTNAQYAVFVQATQRSAPAHWQGAQVPRGTISHPVVNVSWRDAADFCAWVSQVTGQKMTLPTEARWEKAARGSDGRIYPWGNAWDVAWCNTSEGRVSKTSPVGQYSPQGDSPYGCCDMAGNVWEWTSSLYRNYPYQPGDGREDSTSRDRRVVRGGSFDDPRGCVRGACRDPGGPVYRRVDLGLRVAAASPISL